MTACDNDSHFGTGRLTSRRRAVAEAVDTFHGAFTVDDLAGASRERSPGIGIATVYRAVAAMESSGSLERVGSRDGSALYVRCSAEGHHHHLVCTECGRVAHAGCPLDEMLVRPGAAPDGFVVTSHDITLYGLCAACTEGSHDDNTRESRKD